MKVTAADGHEYHKSETANATEAPTNAATLEALHSKVNAPLAKLNQTQADFVMMCQMYFDIYGTLIDSEVALSRYGVEPALYNRLLETEAVGDVLLKNGILKPKRKDPLLSPVEVLSPMEIMACNVMLDLIDTRSDKKKLQDLGLGTQDWARMLRRPAVRSYLEEKTDVLIKNGQHDAALALMDRVRAGDLKSIQFWYELTGRYKPERANSTINVNSNVDQFQRVIANLIEIIIDEVDDHQTAARIADRIKTLIGPTIIANELSVGVAMTPAVEPMRENSAVKAAIEKRTGGHHAIS